LKNAWRLVRGRKENLCLAYVDGETKSGAETARDLAKRLRPGKTGELKTLKPWLTQHEHDDAIVVIVDDFAGTGSTIAKGIRAGMDQFERIPVMQRFLEESRVVCYLLYAFPEALAHLKEEYPRVQFQAAQVFDSEVRALELESGIFSPDELKFAEEMLLQLGRELYSQHPLGHGNMGGLVCFHDIIPNNTLPVFWSNGIVGEKAWRPLFPRK